MQRAIKTLKEFGYILVKRRGSISNITQIISKKARQTAKGIADIVKKAKEKIDAKKGKAYAQSKKESTFNSFKMRNYDFKELESQLLGYTPYDSEKLLE